MDKKNIQFPKYVDVVNKWYQRKKEMLGQADETSIVRWDTDELLYRVTRPNVGKAITDNNPYVNLVDIEEFDLSIENDPYYEYPPTWHNKEKFMEFFVPMHQSITGNPMYYLPQIFQDKERQEKEARGIGVPTPAKEKEIDLLKLKKDIAEYAKTLGFSSVGVTKVDRRMVAPEADDKVIFDTIILLGYEMPMDIMKKHPNPEGEAGAFNAYCNGGSAVHKVADFIRLKGYDCRARVSFDGGIKYAQHIVNAGLGNYSTYGVAISPEGGTRYKFTAVLIDAELPIDQPRDWNIEEFCSRCRMCQKSCPGGAIPKEEMRYRGAIKRQTRHAKCFEYMATYKECMVCVRVCPFSMIGYDTCMDSLPQYYMYNLERDALDKEFLLAKKEGVEDHE